MSSDNRKPKRRRQWPVWALALADLLAILLLIGGWFGARLLSDYLGEDEAFLVADEKVDITIPPSPTPTPAPTATPAPEEKPEETPEPDNRTEWQIRFAEHFTDEVVVTENSYSSPDLSVTITHHEIGEGNDKVTYHLADIYMSNVECFRSGLASTPPKFRMSASLLKMMEDNQAVCAVNGDFCGYSYGGITVRNGTVWSTRGSGVDMCVLYRDGRMATYSPGQFRIDKTHPADDVFQVWSFGPGLLNEDGTPRKIPWSAVPNEHISGKNPRTVIGYFEPGHYCFLVVDGRQKGYSRGASLFELSEWTSAMGCKAAFNLDGGGSSMMGFRGELISKIYAKSPRNLSDIIYVADIPAPLPAPAGPEGTESPGEENANE